MFLSALPVCIAMVIVGVVRHWRWLFWFLLVAFGFSILQPTPILYLMGVVPDPFPAWYSLGRTGVALLEVALAVWMLQIYRQRGVWAMGKKKQTSLEWARKSSALVHSATVTGNSPVRHATEQACLAYWAAGMLQYGSP
jgi:hypothetical protein